MNIKDIPLQIVGIFDFYKIFRNMIKFTKLVDTNIFDKVRTKADILKRINDRTGLPNEVLNNIYEYYDSVCYGDLNMIENEMMKYFNLDNKPTNNNIEIDFKVLAADDFSDKDSIIGFLDRYRTYDTLSLMKYICRILECKTKKPLMESIDVFANDKEYLPEVNPGTLENNIELFSSLKHYLNDLYKRCETVEHLDVYSKIMLYLDNEINELINIENVQSVDNKQYQLFLEDLLNSTSLNPLYNNVDFIKTITPDLQTLMFDLMLLINDYISRDTYTFQNYIDISKIKNYKHFSRLLFESIISSFQISKLIDKTVKKEFKINLDNFIPNSYVAMGRYNYNAIAENCLWIIKSIQGEFNIKIRKYINTYITYTLELLYAYRKIETNLNKTVII